MAKKEIESDLKQFARIGMMACLPGMQYLYERMGRELQQFKSTLALMQELEAGVVKRGRPRSAPAIEGPVINVKRIGAGKSAWTGMSPEERSAEMRRRMEVSRRKKTAKLLPSHRDHPDHAQWAAKMAKVRSAAWARKTKAQKEAWKAAIAAGRTKKGKAKRGPAKRKSVPVVTLAATA